MVNHQVQELVFLGQDGLMVLARRENFQDAGRQEACGLRERGAHFFARVGARPPDGAADRRGRWPATERNAAMRCRVDAAPS